MSIPLDDLIPFLIGTRPTLWEGFDDVFAEWVHRAYGVSPAIRLIQITPRAETGRSAVAIGNRDDGAIVFVATPDEWLEQTDFKPVLMGPISQDDAVVRNANSTEVIQLIPFHVIGVVTRNLGPGAVNELFTRKG
jgi:hypothetical protein